MQSLVLKSLSQMKKCSLRILQRGFIPYTMILPLKKLRE
ncbi:hypothetical protein GECvBMG_gp261 [Salmonella phage GEC_vB_MG]|nr:hypothetical protein GECvBMG_gp261 [Salmonella phage GEC_vB_MG]